ncbi:MAG: type 1 glutamine amidotransferase [Bacteroidales bacterium]|jgi:protease I|nr:type 1 glutamine amidotransferase [Bacteroidales bacterium]MDD4385829.1 type 1 glutamine amidotransferase [Bacteroidales bacterium]MDY0197135.1 type 1 glutamine amidotransferase domain-containing protein [Tenuifilaceae bacterium]
MKKILVLLEKMVEDSEFLYPYLRLQEEGFDVISAAPELKEYQGKGGMVFKPDYSFNEIKSITFDAVIIPGGYAPDLFRRDEGLIRFIRKHDERGKIIVSICHGPWLLISSEIVKGRKVTGFHAIKHDLINAGAIYDGSDWVEDNNFLSATNPVTMLPMIKRLVEKLKE